MKKNMKRVLAILLVCLTIIPFAASALSVSAEEKLDLPIVYVAGKFTYIYNKDETKRLYPLETPLADTIMNNRSKFALDIMAQNWNALSNDIYNTVAPEYKELVLDGNGNIQNGSHIKPVPEPKVKTSNFKLEDYMFTYDSRLDPYYNAQLLNAYINKVLIATGKQKVNLIGRCLGTTLISTFLTVYGCSKVETCIFYAAACNGVCMIGSFFAGDIYFDSNVLMDYLTYEIYDEGGLSSTMKAVIDSCNEFGLLGMGTIGANFAYEKMATTLCPRLQLAIFGTWPGHWAMINKDYYNRAKQVTLPDTKTYAGLITKIDKYQNNVINNFKDTLQKCVNKGMRVAIVSKYNTPIAPTFSCSKIQADGTVELETMSFGAFSNGMGDTFSSSYLRIQKRAGKDKYISKDLMVDASTCLYPDYTWFIRDVAHDAYPSEINQLFMEIFHSSKQYTITTNSKYPQFVSYNSAKDKISEITGPIEDSNANNGPTTSSFFQQILKYILDFCAKVMKVLGIG